MLGNPYCAKCRAPIDLAENDVFLFDRGAGVRVDPDSLDPEE
jgi:hypothetical protein